MILHNLLPPGSISVSQRNATRVQFVNEDMAVTQQGSNTEALLLLKSEVAPMQHLKNLANFRANAALGKQGRAKKECVGVYRYIHGYK